jgi:hypothetical protein
MFLAAEYNVYASYETLPAIMTVAWVVVILMAISLFRQPAGAKRDTRSRAMTSSGISIISLSCSRCGRVVDLPRDKASRQLFCPRCGSTLPRQV